MIIYCATSPSKRQYVGMTTRTLEVRKAEHYNDAINRDLNMAIHKAILKYGNAIIWEVIDTGNTIDELKIKEKAWIEKLGTAKNGYNCSLGGEIVDVPRTQEWADNIAASSGNSPFKVYDLDKKFIGEWINQSKCAKDLGVNKASVYGCLDGRYRFFGDKYITIVDGEDLQEKISACHTHYKPGSQDNMAISHGGKPFKAIKVSTGEIVGEWISRPICAKALGVGTSSIARILTNPTRYNQISGYTFVYTSSEGSEN